MEPPEHGRTRPNPAEPGRTRPESARTHPNLTFSALMPYRTPLFLFLIMAARSFLKRAPNHAPNHKPPIQFQMLVAWYHISFFLVHGISLIEIGARFKNDLPAIIRNKNRGVRYCISAEKVRFGRIPAGFGWFHV